MSAILKSKRRSRLTPHDRELLILRVFGMDKSAFLTFGHVLDYWRNFGSSFTVASSVRARVPSLPQNSCCSL